MSDLYSIGVSRRQHSVALDTAAAELFAASTCACSLISIAGVLRFASFAELGDHVIPIWCDNDACVTVSRDASSIKRLAYVARRVRFLQELEGHVSKMHPVPGTANPADAFTKHLAKPTFKQYMARLYNVSPDVF